MRAQEFIQEYDTEASVNVADILAMGDDYRREGKLKPVSVPLPGFDVMYQRYRDSTGNIRHRYYLFNERNKCVGLFSLEMAFQGQSFPFLRPGVQAVRPHMTLARQYQGQGIATQAYRTFLEGGPWVFATWSHSGGASALWDSLARGNNIDLHWDRRRQQVVDQPTKNSLRILGPQDRFQESELSEDLRKWFREKWVRFNPQGKIMGACARGSEREGKPKCLPQSKAHALGKKGRASAASRKRREDPNPERRGAAKNVATKKK